VREDGLRLVAEKLRAMVEASGLRESESAPSGHHLDRWRRGSADESAGELMKRADQMMYAAKRSGPTGCASSLKGASVLTAGL